MSSAQVINVPNVLSSLRVCLAIPLTYAVLTENMEIAFYVLIAAAVSDWADGYIARRFNMQTQVGAWLDPLADKILLNATFLALAFVDILPFWVALLLLCRDIVIIIGAFLYFKFKRCLDGGANLYGKLSTLIQFSVLVWCVLFPHIEIDLSVFVLMLFVTLGSGLLYIDTWGRLTLKAYQHYIQPKNCE